MIRIAVVARRAWRLDSRMRALLGCARWWPRMCAALVCRMIVRARDRADPCDVPSCSVCPIHAVARPSQTSPGGKGGKGAGCPIAPESVSTSATPTVRCFGFTLCLRRESRHSTAAGGRRSTATTRCFPLVLLASFAKFASQQASQMAAQHRLAADPPVAVRRDRTSLAQAMRPSSADDAPP
jgi:hypothetical protein